VTTIPAGNPAWTRSASIESYGGHEFKENFMSQGVVDARTDVGADQINRLAADLSALTRVAPLAVIIIQNDDTGTNNPTVLGAWLQSGVSSDGYAGASPPAGFPTVTRVSDGSFYVTFPAQLADDFGVQWYVHARGGIGSASGGSAVDVAWAVSDPNTDGYNERLLFTVQDDSGVVIDKLVTVEVF
jgi:hypothetical protein